jgi:hypothetical protein
MVERVRCAGNVAKARAVQTPVQTSCHVRFGHLASALEARHRDAGGRVPAGGNRGVSAFGSQPGPPRFRIEERELEAGRAKRPDRLQASVRV